VTRDAAIFFFAGALGRVCEAIHLKLGRSKGLVLFSFSVFKILLQE
jgi:hypothetical protein